MPRHLGEREQLAEALVLWRVAEQPTDRGSRSRNLTACLCACPRRIRVAPATLDLAPILCTACQQPFQPESHDLDD